MSITSVANSGMAGQLVTVTGRTLDGATVSLSAWNPRYGFYTLGTAIANGDGIWAKSFIAQYNTIIASHEGTAVSAPVTIRLHSLLHFTVTLTGHTRTGYHYRLTGHAVPPLNREFMQVQTPNGTSLGSAHSNANGGFMIHFTLKHKGSHYLSLYANGRLNGKPMLDAFRQHFAINQQ